MTIASRISKLLPLAAVLAMTATSCAVETGETTLEVSKRIFDSWMREKGYDSITPTDVGIYTISDRPGTGDVIRDSMYIFINYNKTTMDGSISAHNSEKLAIQMGSWTVKSRFTPTVWYTADIGIGLRDMILGHDITDNVGTGGMKIGGWRNSIVVPWVKNPDTGKEISTTETVPYIYEIEVVDQTEDIIEYQIDSLERFKRHYPGGILSDVDSSYYGLYTKIVEMGSDDDSIPEGTSISLWYIGKYLDGDVFDTNIKDTAKFYGLYSESSTYSALSFTYYRDSTNAVENNSTVAGFTHSVRSMARYGDKCKTFFTSDYGYGYSGSGNIPGYEPLYFDIWIKEE